MKKKKITIVVLIVGLLFTMIIGFLATSGKFASSKSRSAEKENNESKDKPSNEVENNSISDDNSEDKNIKGDNSMENIPDDEEKKDNPQVTDSKGNQTPSSKQENKTELSSQQTTQSPIKTPTPTPVPKETPTPIPTPTSVPVQKTPWEELGISEYDYYNKPMSGGDEITFRVENYGSKEATETACRNESMRLVEEGIISSCRTVNSYSGRYLGERLTKR